MVPLSDNYGEKNLTTNFDELNLEMRINASVEGVLDLRLMKHGNLWNQRLILIEGAYIMFENKIKKVEMMQCCSGARFRYRGFGLTSKINTLTSKSVRE